MKKRLFDSLSEDDRRRYAAVEATKLGHGGIEYIPHPPQVRPEDHPPRTSGNWMRQLIWRMSRAEKGGDAKSLIEVSAVLEDNFLKVLEDDTAGDPMRAYVNLDEPIARGDCEAV